MLGHILAFLLLFFHVPVFSQLRPGQMGVSKTNDSEAPLPILRPGVFGAETLYIRSSNDLIEALEPFKSYINWTRGELITENSFPLSYQDANIGRNVMDSSARLKDDLLVYAAQALGKIRASAYLNLDDLFMRNLNIRNSILSSLYKLSPENTSVEKSSIKGRLRFPLYGADSISSPFYRNIKSSMITNYLVKSSLENYYDTLIIDLVMFNSFTPSLMTRILNEKGELIHGIETIDPNVLLKQGPVHYVTSITEALAHPARGKKVAYVFPLEITGASLSDIVLFDADIQNLFSQKRSVDNFRAGKVILIHTQ